LLRRESVQEVPVSEDVESVINAVTTIARWVLVDREALVRDVMDIAGLAVISFGVTAYSVKAQRKMRTDR
jgi:hypothetical protein